MNINLPGLRQSARVTYTALIVTMVAVGLSTALDVHAEHLASAASASLLAQAVAAIGVLMSAIAFIIWLFQARRNLGAAGVPGLRWHQSWTIFGWLIPVASLVIPLLVVREIDRAVGPRRPAVFVWWAVTWTAYSLLSYLPLGSHPSTARQLILVTAGTAATVCAILLVRRITANQLEALRPHSPAEIAR